MVTGKAWHVCKFQYYAVSTVPGVTATLRTRGHHGTFFPSKYLPLGESWQNWVSAAQAHISTLVTWSPGHQDPLYEGQRQKIV
jgi:hypothetical protein